VGDRYRLGHNEHIAAPMLGGISHHSFSIAFYLAIYETWKRHAYKQPFQVAIDEIFEPEPFGRVVSASKLL
jgi:hypothetical protein